MQGEKYKSDHEIQAEMLGFLKEISSAMHDARLTPASSFDFIDTAELLQLMHISYDTAKNWRKQNLIIYYRIGGKIYYRISDIERTLKRRVSRRK